ncbi:DUF3301 domain-containing protein [Vibrio gallicus]|uniref:DUF3301 domain-containing protein n=1 Tax=Vibrio gallicus TaxID=190897 RepID=UPI0021C462EB|nr:DUF3301 domain-containing protein [Vibrio gallicus]
MDHLLLILGLAIILALFWQHRKQTEVARMAIERYCNKMELQVVSISSGAHKLRDHQGRWYRHTEFAFEFSALGDDCYQGRLIMQGMRIMDVQTQAHRM